MRSATMCTGQSDATHVVSTPSTQHVTWNRVTIGRPGTAKRGPTRTMTIQ